ncbi:hypothetical protein ACJX0J_042062, partial [Zea mays]
DHAEKVDALKDPPDVLDVAIVGGGMMALAVACALSNMPLTKHLRVAIIDSNPAVKSRSYLGKNNIPDSRVSTVTPATISFFKGMIPNQLCASSYLISAVFQLSTVFGFKFELVCSGVISSSRYVVYTYIYTFCLINYTMAWTGKHDDQMTRHYASATAAAIHTNLQSKGGLLSTFEAMRDTARDGQIVFERNVDLFKNLVHEYDYTYWSCSVARLGYSGIAVISR